MSGSKTLLFAGAALAAFVVTYEAFGPGSSGGLTGGAGQGPSPR